MALPNHFLAPPRAVSPRPRPPPTPMPAPLRCRACGEEVFPNGNLRDCRCDRRFERGLAVFVVLFVGFLVAVLTGVVR